MGQRKKKIEDPLKLLLPSVIYDYFELVHTEVSDIDVHLLGDHWKFTVIINNKAEPIYGTYLKNSIKL